MIVPALVLATACGGGDDPDPPVPDAAPGDPFAPPTGTILIAEQRGNFTGQDVPASAVSATITDGPRSPRNTETERRGECRLLKYLPAPCPEPCDGVCTVDGCILYPRGLDAGSIEVTGTHDPISLWFEPVTGRYRTDPYPIELFDADAELHAVSAGGDDVPAFALAVRTPAALETTIASPFALAAADDAELQWTAGGADTQVFLTISDGNLGHGGPYPTIIECASPDDGSIIVPGAFVAELGVLDGTPCFVGNECPPAVLTRYRRASVATTRGEIELWAATERVFYVTHAPP
jgi:hypothetical protein